MESSTNQRIDIPSTLNLKRGLASLESDVLILRFSASRDLYGPSGAASLPRSPTRKIHQFEKHFQTAYGGQYIMLFNGKYVVDEVLIQVRI